MVPPDDDFSSSGHFKMPESSFGRFHTKPMPHITLSRQDRLPESIQTTEANRVNNVLCFSAFAAMQCNPLFF